MPDRSLRPIVIPMPGLPAAGLKRWGTARFKSWRKVFLVVSARTRLSELEAWREPFPEVSAVA